MREKTHTDLTAAFKERSKEDPHFPADPAGRKIPAESAERGENDTQTDVLPGLPGSAKCVQRFDDSRNSAIHITYRSSLRSSSLREPRDPLLKVVFWLKVFVYV